MKAIIDLDWVDDQIVKLKRDLEKSKTDTRHIPPYVFFEAGLKSFKEVRSKCEPIEQPFILEVEGMVTISKEPLPTKCELDWESAKYCHNDNKCELCKTKSVSYTHLTLPTNREV